MDIVVAVATQELDFIIFTMVGESAFDSRAAGGPVVTKGESRRRPSVPN